jgi:hypothetical protein
MARTLNDNYVCCAADGEPLIFTFERAGKEYVCQVCGKWTAFFDGGHISKPWTPELEARHDELHEQYLAARKEREIARA